jgi:Bacterial Ig-like domain (group 3)
VRIRRSVAAGAVAAVTAALALPLLALPASASGNTTPTWEPDPNTNFGTSTTPNYGTLTFYNSAGQVVTSGTNLAHLFDYAEGSVADPYDGTKATLYFGLPTPGEATGIWFTALASASTSFPNSSAPAPLNTATNPVVTLTSADADLTNFIASTQGSTMAGYADVYQVRVLTTGPGGVGSGPNGQYWDADVTVDPSNGTWAEVYPTQGTVPPTTTTALTASPSGSAQQGASVTLTATVTASDSTHPAGSVQFFQGGTSLGAAVTVSSAGVATLTTSAQPPSAPNGTTFTAKFTPTDSDNYVGSTGTLAYTVNPVAPVPATSGPHQAGATETCSAPKPSSGVTQSFSWLANGKTIGTGSSLVVPGSAYKQALQCQVAEHDGSGPTSTAKSASVTVSLGKAPRATRKPTLSGSAKVGKTVKVKAGTWSLRGVKFTYQWLLNGKVIKHATKSSLKLSRADNGKKLSCRVTAHETGFANGVATTKSVKVS